MANILLNKSRIWKSEAIRGRFVITVDEVDPAIPAIDILGASLEMIVKDDKNKPDSEALALLTVGDGLEVVENTSLLYEVIYRIPGSATANLVAPNERETSVPVYYEINLTLENEEDSDVLESGTIRINTDRVKKFS